MRSVARSLLPAIVLTAFVAPTLRAQSVSDIVEGMYASYERQAANVDDYTVVQATMGFESSTYFEKEMVDGRPVFRVRGTSGPAGGYAYGLGSDDPNGMGNIYEMGPDLIANARYAGLESIGGGSAHVLEVDDLSQLQLGQQPTPDEMEFNARNGRMFIDAEMMVPRRFEFVGDATTPNGVHEVTVSIDQQDFRDFEGLLVPFRTIMQITGLQAMIDPEMQEQLREMEAQLEALPPQQREMMERMMGDQLEQLRQMMAGDGDAMTVEVTISEVRVNAGPPSE